MSGYGISTHGIIDEALRISRRRFLTKVAAAGLATGVPVCTTIAQETQRSSIGEGKGVSLGETLASYAASLRYENLPEDVIRIAKRTILDTLGCAFGGYTAGPSKIAMKLASDVNSKQAGTILLSGIKSSPDLAVFANGVMIRYLDFNDAYVSQMNGAGHPSDTVAALLTAAELRQRSGRDLITAAVLAYEVYCKIGDVFDYLGHGIDHTTVTGMGAVVGAGKLMGLSPEEIVHAIGITVGGNTATRQGRADTLSNWKAYAAADACRKAIFS
ncbi:MAG: MmgE/PrpD family protein, partial [Pseudolabrys sp.]